MPIGYMFISSISQPDIYRRLVLSFLPPGYVLTRALCERVYWILEPGHKPLVQCTTNDPVATSPIFDTYVSTRPKSWHSNCYRGKASTLNAYLISGSGFSLCHCGAGVVWAVTVYNQDPRLLQPPPLGPQHGEERKRGAGECCISVCQKGEENRSELTTQVVSVVFSQ